MDLTNEDVTDILALLDSLPYDELDLQTTRFRLTLRRTPDGWTQSVESRGAPTALDATPASAAPSQRTKEPSAGSSGAGATGSMPQRSGHNRLDATTRRTGLETDGVSGERVSGGTAIGGGEAATGGGEAAAGGGEAATGGGAAATGGGEAATGSGEAATGSGDDGDGRGRELVAVRAPLPGTFYRAPRPGAAPFVEVGSRVGAETVVGIVETMKLMNSVTAGVDGMVTEICVANAEFAPHGTTLLRIRAD
jgi:acetyl-CoA carboxylase biotin carboxyl carrier protein